MKFSCKACGQCCSHIQGFIPDKETIKELGYGKLPLINLFPVEKLSFPLWDWEAKRFMQTEIEHKIKPSRIIFDLNSNKTIVVNYSIDSEACTFLKDNKCQIYEKRALVCRFFPFQHGPFLSSEKPSKQTMFGSCPVISEMFDKLNDEDKKEYVKQLYESFGENLIAIVQNDIITEWSNKMIIELMKKQLIRPAMNYPYDKLLKRVENSEKIDFTDFLKEKNLINKEIIEKFESMVEARELIEHFSK